MGLARDIVDLSDRLRGEDAAFNPFAPRALSALAKRIDATAAAERLGREVDGDPLAVVRLILQALAVQRSELEPGLVDAELVATLPGTLPSGAFSTAHAVSQMLCDGAKEVIALGYEVSYEDVLKRLQELSQGGTSVVLIVDRKQSRADELKAAWPVNCPVKIYVARTDEMDAAYAKMHGKALLVDNDDLLITSANFTFHGHRGNIELGVRLRGAPARDARTVLDHMVNRGIVELI